MKRKCNPQKADRDNPVWAKETFARARKARNVLPEMMKSCPFGAVLSGEHIACGFH